MSDDLSTEPLDELLTFPPQRFLMLEDVGSGTHASIMQAWDRQLNRRVACKITFDVSAVDTVDPELLDEAGLTEPVREQLKAAEAPILRYTALREARLLALVVHPNVIPLIDVGLFQDGVVALVMPYLEGGTLENRRFTEPWQDVLAIAVQIGRGLAAIHDAGILHRDLKPNNIVFDGKRWPFIIDLGLSCLLSDATSMADRVGTRDYMPPKVIARGFQDVRDDLYAYCMIVYEMFYGHSPFASGAARGAGRVTKSARADRLPRALVKILERGLAPNAEQRWPDMPALLDALENVQQPAQRRWRWAAAAAGLGMAASLVFGLLAVSRPAHADACDDIRGELEQIWDDEIQAELRGAFGSRQAGDGLERWAGRWLNVRAAECNAAKRSGASPKATPCSASVRDRFQATVQAFRTPHLREGLSYATVIAALPAPDHCIDHPEDAEWGYGGLLELRNIDVEVQALVGMGDLEVARARQQDYMDLSLELRSEYGIARATFWRGEIRRLEGELDGAVEDLERAYRQAWALGLGVFGAEVQMKLAAVAGARGEIAGVDAHALGARAVFAEYRPDRMAELLQVHGLALVAGPERVRARGVGLLLHAVELREAELQEHGGTRELLSAAHESYARGLLAVNRAGEALEYLDLALRVHQEEFGHGSWRTRGILMQKFRALVDAGTPNQVDPVVRAILQSDAAAENWKRYLDDAAWMADIFTEADLPNHAVWLLRAGRTRAAEVGLADDVARFDAKLEDIE
ncbi:serine/threonine-protein kinase [Enhygromyxa salina]|uniref:Serine/threonine-protein kinase PrkC n=1 Tax=Enhygromyxa salina TaxID=215803 RepID=A0A2S9Y3I9_9BACT|nr:serine/threonine-protein kinase [Enhygromyxa salina]PRP99664.1 Serine/threonine-protein kinase PrkC [Enhygromyxa salina]